MRSAVTVAAAVALVLAAGAWGDVLGTATIKYTGNYTDGTIKVWGGGLSGVTGYGGFYLLDKNAGTGEGELIPNGTVNSFCMELTEEPSKNYTVYNVESIGGAKGAHLSELWGRYFSPTMSKANAELFSACVWEIWYEEPSVWDVSAGPGFRCTGITSATTANGWLASLDGTGPMANVRTLTHPSKQDFLVEVPVPEPGSIALLASGLLGLAAIARKR